MDEGAVVAPVRRMYLYDLVNGERLMGYHTEHGAQPDGWWTVKPCKKLGGAFVEQEALPQYLNPAQVVAVVNMGDFPVYYTERDWYESVREHPSQQNGGDGS